MPPEEEVQEEVTLTENDMAVIDELNSEVSGEDFQEESENTVGREAETYQDTDIQDEDYSIEDESIGASYDPYLVNRAQAYGLDPNAFASEEVLSQILDGFDNGNAQLSQWENWYQQYNGQQNDQQQGDFPQHDGQAQSGVQPFSINLDDDYDEGLKDAINGLANQMHGHYSQQFEILAGELLRQQGAVNYAQNQQQIAAAQGYLDSFNGAVDSLDNSRLFGGESYETLEPGSSHAQNRERLYDQIRVLEEGYYASGQQPPDYDLLVEQAYHSAFGNEIEKINRDRFNDRMRKASKRRLGSGTSTAQPAGPNPEDPVNNPVLKEVYEDMLKENGDL
jgi:hypothetical protein